MSLQNQNLFFILNCALNQQKILIIAFQFFKSLLKILERTNLRAQMTGLAVADPMQIYENFEFTKCMMESVLYNLQFAHDQNL